MFSQQVDGSSGRKSSDRDLGAESDHTQRPIRIAASSSRDVFEDEPEDDFQYKTMSWQVLLYSYVGSVAQILIDAIYSSSAS